jgi:excisionase family DNA binding protein
MKLLTTKEASQLFKVTRATILNWAKNGKLKSHTVPQGKTYYEVDKETLQLLKENLKKND